MLLKSKHWHLAVGQGFDVMEKIDEKECDLIVECQKCNKGNIVNREMLCRYIIVIDYNISFVLRNDGYVSVQQMYKNKSTNCQKRNRKRNS